MTAPVAPPSVPPSAAPPAPPTSYRPPRRTPAARVLWLLAGTGFALLVLSWGTFMVVSLLAHESIRTDAVFEGPVEVVEVHADAGPVRIERTRETGAEVHLSIERGLQAPSHSERLTDGRLVLRSSCPPVVSVTCHVGYRVVVPGDAVVVVEASGGAVSVDSGSGAVVAEASGGGIHVEDVSGLLRLDSSGGSITGLNLRSRSVDASSSGGSAHLEFLVPPERVAVSSSGGSVDVVVPRDGRAYRVQAMSMGTAADVAVPTDPASPRSIDASSTAGQVWVRHPTG